MTVKLHRNICHHITYYKDMLEDYLCFEKEYLYNYDLMGFDKGKNKYYKEHYGIVVDKYVGKSFTWTRGEESYITYVLGCQKAFDNKNRIFLGQYTSEKYGSTLGIELEIRNMSYILMFRIDFDIHRTNNLINKKMERWKLTQRVDYHHDYDDDDYGREITENYEKTIESWILQVQPKIHATIEFEEETIILEEIIRCSNITIGAILKSIKKTYKECEKLLEGSLGIYAYFDRELEVMEEEYDWREDYISPRDYYGSSDWE